MTRVIQRISPTEAQALMSEGYIYLDVRTVAEFDAGHPLGAYNVPFVQPGASGLESNPEFSSVVLANFEPSTKIVVGCKAGHRSLRALDALLQAGYATVVDQRAGYDGARSPFGEIQEPGWGRQGLPVSVGPQPGRSYEDLRLAARR